MELCKEEALFLQQIICLIKYKVCNFRCYMINRLFEKEPVSGVCDFSALNL